MNDDKFSYTSDHWLYRLRMNDGKLEQTDQIPFKSKADYFKTEDPKKQKYDQTDGWKDIYVSVYNCVGQDGEPIGTLILNIGETEAKDSIWGRYPGNKSKESSMGTHRVLDIHHINVRDEYKNMKLDSKLHDLIDLEFPDAPRSNISSEFREIKSWETLKKLLDFISNKVNEFGEIQTIRKEKPVYEDIIQVVGKAIRKMCEISKIGFHVCASLCCRYGKTMTAIMYWRFSTARIAILSSYVGTVAHSYKSTIDGTVGFEDSKFIDTTTWPSYTDHEKKQIMKRAGEWLDRDPHNKVMIYIPLTGTGPEDDKQIINTTFNARADEVLKFIKSRPKNDRYMMINDEVDYGTHRPKQIKKLNNFINNAFTIISLSGTNANKCEVLKQIDYNMTADYLMVSKLVKENRLKMGLLTNM